MAIKPCAKFICSYNSVTCKTSTATPICCPSPFAKDRCIYDGSDHTPIEPRNTPTRGSRTAQTAPTSLALGDGRPGNPRGCLHILRWISRASPLHRVRSLLFGVPRDDARAHRLHELAPRARRLRHLSHRPRRTGSLPGQVGQCSLPLGLPYQQLRATHPLPHHQPAAGRSGLRAMPLAGEVL